ncbi:Transcriptional regulator MraZ [Oligella ureolytica]
MIFQGNHPSIDVKGRMMIPARYRDVLLEEVGGQLTFTRNFDGGLLVYPKTPMGIETGRNYEPPR